MHYASLAKRAATKAGSLASYLRELFGQRAAGIVAALALEILLFLLLLTLGQGVSAPKGADSTISSFDVRSEEPAENDEPRPEPEKSDTRPQPQDNTAPQPVVQPEMKERAAIIPVLPREIQSFDLSKSPNAPPKAPAQPQVYGPVFTGPSDDDAAIGTAPNGEPLYVARWYREPSDDELRGFLSTASGPGWALIACKTVPEWRVEDCVGLGEYPQGSQIQRAVLAAAWQFRVRPPKRGGRSLVGSWVRIRISYTDH